MDELNQKLNAFWGEQDDDNKSYVQLETPLYSQ